MQSRDFSIYGAVDLGARQQAAQRTQQTAQTGAADDTGTAVIDVTEETFNSLVVELILHHASHHRPVGGMVRPL